MHLNIQHVLSHAAYTRSYDIMKCQHIEHCLHRFNFDLFCLIKLGYLKNIRDSNFKNCIFLCVQESLLRFGKETLAHKNNDVKQKEVVRKLGQVSLMLGAFAVAAFTVKQIFA